MKARSTHTPTQVLASHSWREANRRMDRQILKIFLPGFRIQSEILTDFRILQLQWIVNSTIFWARILDFACNKSIFAQILESGEILTADLVNKSQQISGFAYSFSPPSSCMRTAIRMDSDSHRQLFCPHGSSSLSHLLSGQKMEKTHVSKTLYAKHSFKHQLHTTHVGAVAWELHGSFPTT